jgi:hypothetical protein
MKARRVKGVDPEAPLADALERIIRVRLDELCSFMPAASDPLRVRELHDMRIAAKRLRYLLELGGHCFGSYAPRGAKIAKDLQDLLGGIHDCDVLLPRIGAEISQLRLADARAVGERAGRAGGLDPRQAAGLPGAPLYRGLESLVAYTRARRELLFAHFLERWQALERQAFRARLEFALGERAGPQAGDDTHQRVPGPQLVADTMEQGTHAPSGLHGEEGPRAA